MLSTIYRVNLSLATDFYNLTSAYALWASGDMAGKTCFHMYFRKAPFGGDYALTAGLEYLVDWMRNFRFERADLDFLAQQVGNDEKPLFEDLEFFDFLEQFQFRCDVDAIPEGTVVFANEPLVRVIGTVIECLLIETFCLNVINAQTLWATKAARICREAGTDPVMEFGLRRSQDFAGLGPSRSAYIGGCVATSNVLAARLFGIPVKGTHQHAFVMMHDDDRDAFLSYADALPNNCTFLVDTFNTIDGIQAAITVASRLQERGYKPVGIRLDSGDLGELAKMARLMLDAAGLQDMIIVASNDLDEYTIAKLKVEKAPIDSWGVGTRLTTSYDQPALGGVFKLAALVNYRTDQWEPRIKLSSDPLKTTTPGRLNVRRYFNMFPERDAIFDMELGIEQKEGEHYEDLLKPVFRQGRFIGQLPTVKEIRERAQSNLRDFAPAYMAMKPEAHYPVELEHLLSKTKEQLIREKSE
jgi:nicotinate phosphoribosyltransferase